MNWFIKVSENPVATAPEKPEIPSVPGWEYKGWGKWYEALFPFLYSNSTGAIQNADQGAWQKAFDAFVWEKMGLTALIAAPETEWLSEADTAILCKVLGADGYYTPAPYPPPSTVIPQCYIVWDSEGDCRTTSAGLVLHLLRMNGPAMGLSILTANLTYKRNNVWKPPFFDIDAFLEKATGGK